MKCRRWLLCPLCLWLMALTPPGGDAGFLTRVELLALIQTLNAELLSHPSATATLEGWCGDHRLASDAKILARLERGAEKEPGADGYKLLALEPGQKLRYRHVRLFCGDKLLSEADNWYVPERLTAEMNRLLDETDTPFGRAVSDLHFRRETLGAKLLWSPLPAHWEMSAVPAAPEEQARPSPSEGIIAHRALLRTAGGTPFALVAETYKGALFDFSLPR
jgi:hypothetical protein